MKKKISPGAGTGAGVGAGPMTRSRSRLDRLHNTGDSLIHSSNGVGLRRQLVRGPQ